MSPTSTGRPRAHAAFLALVLLCVACASPRPAHVRRAGLPPDVTLIGQNISLEPGAANAVRIAFGAIDTGARVIVTTTPDTAAVVACPLGRLDEPIVDPEHCQTVASGVREAIESRGMRAIGIVLLSSASVRADVVLAFDAVGRATQISIPSIPGGSEVACADNGCNPFFELRPVRNGTFTASATFQGPAATLVMLQGTVVGRSQTATGIPYREAARTDGPSPLSLRGQLTAPGEYALALRATGSIRDVQLDITWP